VKFGQRGETCTPAPSVPNGGCCCYTTRCLPRRLEGAGGLVRLDPDSGILVTKSGGEWRTRRDLHPQPSRRQRVAPLVELRIRKLVGGAGNAPVVASGWFCDTGFTGRQPERLPVIKS